MVIAAAGPPRARIGHANCRPTCDLPDGFREPRVCLPGILAVPGPPYRRVGARPGRRPSSDSASAYTARATALHGFPLIVVVDDSDFTARTLNNFLWVTFTRSNPAADVYGIEAFTQQKHWGCRGSLVIDARIKPHHAPPLVEDPDVTKRVDALAARGGPLAKYL